MIAIAITIGVILVLNVVLIIASIINYFTFRELQKANEQVITDVCKIEDSITKIKELIEGTDLPNAN